MLFACNDSVQVVPEKIGGHGECYGGNNTKRNEVPEELSEGKALKVNASDEFQCKAERIRIRNDLEEPRHIIDRRDDAGEKSHRHHQDYDIDKHLLHVLGNGGNDEAASLSSSARRRK